MTVQYDDFAETFGKSRDGLHWPEIDQLLEYFLEHNPSEQSWNLLDIGCGNGRLLEHILESEHAENFSKHSIHYTGIDLSENLLAQARSKALFSSSNIETQWIQGNMLEIGKIIPEQRFSGIFFIASFHHLASYYDRQKVLHDIKKYLTPESRIYMTNWNLSHSTQSRYESSVMQTYDDESRDYMIKIGAHERFYHAFSETSFQALLQETGYVAEVCDFSGRNSVAVFRLAD